MLIRSISVQITTIQSRIPDFISLQTPRQLLLFGQRILPHLQLIQSITVFMPHSWIRTETSMSPPPIAAFLSGRAIIHGDTTNQSALLEHIASRSTALPSTSPATGEVPGV